MCPFHVLSPISFSIFLLSHSICADETIKNSEKAQASFPLAGFCENRLSAFTVSDNTCFVSNSSLVYKDVTEEVCLKMCSGNRDNSGRTILCASLVYDYGAFVCTIYRSKSYPEGDLKTEVAQGKRLFEKFCLNDNVPANCADSHFLKVDQSVIIGYAKNVSLTRSVEECIEQCLMEHFQCKSAMYFYTEGECITNTESAMTQPTSFAREKNDKVIYIQNGCPAAIARQKQLENPTTQAMGSLFTARDKAMESANDQVETLSLATPVSWASDDNMNNEEKEKETASTAVISIINSSTDPHTVLKQWSDSEERMGNDGNEEQNGNSFSEDSGKSASSEEETTEIATIEEKRKMLEQNVKKVETESRTISFDKHSKPLEHAKLQQVEKEFVPKDNEDNYFEKNSPLEVVPSPVQDENQHGEGLDSVVALEKAEAQKPIKRLKIRTLNEFKDDDHFSEWSNWSPCRRPGERRIRRRKCYNLKKCIGALMEVNQCPKTVQKAELEFGVPDNHGLQTMIDGELVSAPSNGKRNLANKTDHRARILHGFLPEVSQSHSENESTKKRKKKKNEKIWSSWRGICQEFASGHSCKNHEIIGFESRDCLATDNTECEGPFFRYCTIPC